MPEFLTFALYAPIASFGSPAVGERRGSFGRPARSAALGLIGACLGIDRADEAAQQALSAGYGLAIRAESSGSLLPDYHTAQMPPAKRGRRFATRAAELDADDLSTVLSRIWVLYGPMQTRAGLWVRWRKPWRNRRLCHRSVERPAHSVCPLRHLL